MTHHTNPLILVGDDSWELVHAIRRVLEPEGYQVETTDDLRGLVDWAQRYEPDCIVARVFFEGSRGGFSLAGILALDPETSQLSIVICTGGVVTRLESALIHGAHPNIQAVVSSEDGIDALIQSIRVQAASGAHR